MVVWEGYHSISSICKLTLRTVVLALVVSINGSLLLPAEDFASPLAFVGAQSFGKPPAPLRTSASTWRTTMPIVAAFTGHKRFTSLAEYRRSW
jgi:hypothetical protein